MRTKPTCLHIPPLYEADVARLIWESVDDADGYELDVHYDEDFETASTGRRWSDVDMAGLSVAEIEAKNLTWEQIAKLPAQGLSWKNIEFHNRAWSDIDESPLSWEEIQKLHVEFTEYKGEGEKTQGPDQGLVWANINSSGLDWTGIEALNWSWEDFMFRPSVGINWAQIQSENLNWAEIEARGKTWYQLERQAARGLDWGSLNARFLDWSEIAAKNLTWQQFEHLPADSQTHIAHNVDIPLYKKKAIFRVRAYKDGEKSEYITSTLSPVIPVFYREDSVHISATAGSKYLVQLHAREIEDFKGIVMALKYDSTVLRLEQFVLEKPAGKSDMSGKVYTGNIREVSQTSGQICFQNIKQMKTGQESSGLIVSARFKALRTVDADITLS